MDKIQGVTKIWVEALDKSAKNSKEEILNFYSHKGIVKLRDVFHVCAWEAWGGSRVIAPLILNFGTRQW
jgi:hypothetical protein